MARINFRFCLLTFFCLFIFVSILGRSVFCSSCTKIASILNLDIRKIDYYNWFLNWYHNYGNIALSLYWVVLLLRSEIWYNVTNSQQEISCFISSRQTYYCGISDCAISGTSRVFPNARPESESLFRPVCSGSRESC